MWHCHSLVLNLIVNVNVGMSVLFCSSAVLDARVGHTMNILSPFISVLCHSDWLPWWALSASWCCPSRLCVVFSPASIWQCSLHYLFLPRLLGMSVWQAEWRLWWRAAWHYFSLSFLSHWWLYSAWPTTWQNNTYMSSNGNMLDVKRHLF